MKKLIKIALWKRILAAVILGLILGFAWPEGGEAVSILGDIFIALMKMLLIPFVFFSLVAGVCSLGDISLMRTIGLRYVLWIVCTTLFAAALSVGLCMIFNPGAGVDIGASVGSGEELAVSYSFAETLLSWIPSSIVGSMADNQLLPVILFAILLGCCILAVANKAQIVIQFTNQCMEVFTKMTNWIVQLCPIGIFGLVAPMVPKFTGTMIANLGKFLLIDFIGCGLLLIVVYPLLLMILQKINPLNYYKKNISVLVMAAATGSSAATLPLEMQVSQEQLGIDERVYSFTLPLGNTCNMNAAAVAQACVAVFALNIYGFQVTPLLVFQIVIMACLMAVGTVGINGAQIVISTVMLTSLGLPLDLVAILSPLWAVVDPVNTATNCMGNMVGTGIVAKSLKMMDEDILTGKKKFVAEK